MFGTYGPMTNPPVGFETLDRGQRPISKPLANGLPLEVPSFHSTNSSRLVPRAHDGGVISILYRRSACGTSDAGHSDCDRRTAIRNPRRRKFESAQPRRIPAALRLTRQ